MRVVCVWAFLLGFLFVCYPLMFVYGLLVFVVPYSTGEIHTPVVVSINTFQRSLARTLVLCGFFLSFFSFFLSLHLYL